MSYFFFNGYYSYEMGLTVCFPHQVLALRQTKAPIDLQYDFTTPRKMQEGFPDCQTPFFHKSEKQICRFRRAL